ncbi:MAG: hypothetical protein A3I73_02615 [Omnitrophica bacterium RIFCSPLOWO2_02_FULL_45_16]|nr:MAG: hypothetical protein A3I73_02615 [Omnitrophica bacterium RIFCSPLOWO2_02_FULL_45_16]
MHIKELGNKILSRKVLMLVIVSIIICAFMLVVGENAFAKCEAALKRLQAAEAELDAANAAYNAAKQAMANLNAAVANLNAAAKKLGATGKATAEGMTFGRSPSNSSFFENQEYKTAKQAWQDARDAYDKTGGIDAAGARRMRAQGEYDEAKAEYERLRAEHIGDAGYLREPEALKLDEKLSKDVEDLIKEQTLSYQIDKDDTLSDIDVELKRLGKKTLLEVSVVSKGKGAQGGRWSPVAISLAIGPTTLSPTKAKPFSVITGKRSTANVAVPGILSAIGSQHISSRTKTASYAGGAACPTGTESRASQGRYKSGLIGRVGVAAGMGLLAARERGPGSAIKGLKATFDVTGREAALTDIRLRATIDNQGTRRIVYIDTPIDFERRKKVANGET